MKVSRANNSKRRVRKKVTKMKKWRDRKRTMKFEFFTFRLSFSLLSSSKVRETLIISVDANLS